MIGDSVIVRIIHQLRWAGPDFNHSSSKEQCKDARGEAILLEILLLCVYDTAAVKPAALFIMYIYMTDVSYVRCS